MKPLRLRARNLRTFPSLDIEFEHGLVGILGELRDAPEGADSNGAGKSTILEAIDIALFGRRSLAGYLTRGGDVDELMIELTFEHAGELYRVRRTFSAKGRGKTSVDLERNYLRDEVDERGERPDSWIPLTCASAKETDALLVATIGLSRDTYRDSAYLRQGDGSYADPDRDARQRKELLVEAVLGRDPVWPRLADQAKQRRKTSEAQLERIQGETRAARELADQRPSIEKVHDLAAANVTAAEVAVEAGEAKVEELQERYRAARDIAANRQAAQALVDAAAVELEELERREAAAAAAGSEISVAREELDMLTTAGQLGELEQRERDLAALLEEYRLAGEERDRATSARREALQRKTALDARAEEARGKAAALRRDAEQLQARPLDDEARCDHCGQVLGAEARAERLAAYERDAAGFDTDAAKLTADAAAVEVPDVPDPAPSPMATLGSSTLPAADVLDDVRAQLTRAREEQTRRARLEERVVQLQRAVDERPEADTIAAARALVNERNLALADLEPVDLTAIEKQGLEARAALDTDRRLLADAIAAKARVAEQLTQITAAEKRLQDAAVATGQLQADVDRDLLLERCYGRDGIPALIIENSAIPYLETEASRILGLLGTSFQVELRTQAENKTGGLRDTLDVIVIDPDGNEADFADGCSGGEQTRIGLALRIALARLLAHRRGAESRLLALDEPSYLDQAGMTALLDVLRGLADDFDVILLVSHVPELRDALDQTVVVVKERGRSTIAGAAVTEEVAA